MSTISFSPSNSIVFVEDAQGGVPPEHTDDALVHSTPTCVSVGCYPDVDGETELTLEMLEEAPAGLQLVYDGLIKTPSRLVVMTTVLDERLLETKVPKPTTRLRVWVDHAVWPKRLVAGCS